MNWFKNLFKKKLKISEEELTDLEYSVINLQVLKLALIKKSSDFNDAKYDEMIEDLDSEIKRISEILANIRYKIA